MRILKTLAGAAALLLAANVHAGATVGAPAPAFSLTGADGARHSLADYAGKYVVLEWTNDQCPFVKKHYTSGNMQAQQKEFTGKGVVWLSIITGAEGKQGVVSPERANALSTERGAAPTQVLFDPTGDTGRAYDAKTTPHMFVVDPKGNVIYAGGIDSVQSSDADDVAGATQYVRVALNQALAGQPVAQPVTKPYGCSVKY